MAYCTYCGKELKDGARYCNGCGKKVENVHTEEYRRETVFEGKIHKCPNCGATVKAFLSVCPECGVEFRNTMSSTAVKEFLRKLEVLESNRVSRIGDDPVDDQVLNLIRNFSIPNNKEDIFEFIILAASNINMSVVAARSFSDIGATCKEEFLALNAKNDAWISKFDQAYEKARISFESGSDFKKIKEIYERTTKSLKKAKSKRTIKKIIMIILIVIFLGGPFIYLIIFPPKKKNNTAQSIYQGKDYDYYRNSSNGSPDNAPAIDINKLAVDAIYPRSDIGSNLYKDINLAPETIYHTMASENGLKYTPYIVTGKVIKTGYTFFEEVEYFGLELDDEDEDYEEFWFILENEYGKIFIYDDASKQVRNLQERKKNGEFDDKDSSKFVNFFISDCGYEKYDYPKEGEKVAILGIYKGLGLAINDIPCMEFGINEFYYDWIVYHNY